MEKPTIVAVNNKEYNPDVKLTSADLKAGAGNMSEEDKVLHDNFFSEPVIKTQVTSMGPPPAKVKTVTKAQKRQNDASSEIGAGARPIKKSKFSGKGISFK